MEKVQKTLVNLRYPMPITTRRGIFDGIYGKETADTVRAFQKDYGLKVDGVVGRKTIRKLDELLYPLCDKCLSQSEACLDEACKNDVYSSCIARYCL